MSEQNGSPFESIESAHEFVALLAETVRQAKQDVEADVKREASSGSPRHLDALRTALYSMEKLEQHMNKSRRILNDLRSLRRLLFEERATKPQPLAPVNSEAEVTVSVDVEPPPRKGHGFGPDPNMPQPRAAKPAATRQSSVRL
ncbi:MAG: hypothetical protein WAN65_03860 [Candidatus Sulfotelmatobacter sp.]